MTPKLEWQWYYLIVLQCGQAQAAQPWFLKAHSHAVANGDQASIDALLYNRAAFTIGRLRVENCLGNLDKESLRRVRMELTSSVSLTSLVDSNALLNYSAFVAARLALLEGHYEEASAKLQAIRHQSPFASSNFDQAYIELELCYCDFCQSDTNAVSAYLHQNRPHEFPNLDIDEQIVASWMLWQMSIDDPRFGDALSLHARFDALRTDYMRSRAKLLDSLRPFMQ